jgi:ABC-2 type transport system permease protein
MFQRITGLVKKEFLALFNDKKSRTVVIIPPIVQLIVFGYAATYDLEKVPFAIYNEDHGALSRELTARFEGSPNFQKIADISDNEKVKELIDRQKILLSFHLGQDFTQNLLTHKPAKIQVIIDGRNSNTAMIALNYTRAVLMDFSRKLIPKNEIGTEPAVLTIRAWYNPNLESRWFIVPGIMGVLTLLVAIIVTALSVAREREQGTFDQLLVTPMTPVEILIGKSLPGLIIGFLEGSLILLLALIWFHIPFKGNLLYLYAGLFVFLLSAVGVGLMISSLTFTQQQGLLGAFLFMVPSIILSGFTTPIENMPLAVQKITLLNPMRYFMVVLRGAFLEDAPFSLFLRQYWPMALIGLATLSAAAFLFRHRVH